MDQATALFVDRLDYNEAVDIEARYDDFLNEIYDLSALGGPFSCLQAAKVIKEFSPTDYRCGCVDYADGQDWTEGPDGETYETRYLENLRDEIDDELDSEISDLEEEADGLELELDDLDASYDCPSSKCDQETAIQEAIETKRTEAARLEAIRADLKKLF